MIFFGPTKTETVFMIFFYTKHRYIDISGFDGGNPDFYLHCLGIFYVHVQVYIYIERRVTGGVFGTGTNS